jgi:hypothetical protein
MFTLENVQGAFVKLVAAFHPEKLPAVPLPLIDPPPPPDPPPK